MHLTTHRTLSYLVENFSTITSIPQIAANLNCNYNTLRITFRKDFGESLRTVISKYRCDRSIEYLENKNMKLSAVAKRVGFSSDKYYIQVFRKYYNLSPVEYRKQRFSV
jgi:two-component system, response regulator YesN